MEFKWFSFDESYLLSIDYNIALCKLIMAIDARMSIDHPKAVLATSREEQFETIEVSLAGVQYFKSVTNKNILNHQASDKDDLGSIEYLYFNEQEEMGKEFMVNFPNPNLFLDFNGKRAEVPTLSTKLKIITFISEMLNFRAGFEEVMIRKLIS